MGVVKWMGSGYWAGGGGSFVETGLWVSLKVTFLDK